MKSRVIKLCSVLVAMMFLTVSAMAQNKTVTGTVVDNSGEPIIGANVVVKGTSQGATTDFDGKFSITNVPERAMLHVTFVGYAEQDVSVAGKSVINITLVEDSEMLEDVVVVGYGVQRKSDVTGAVMRVDSKTLESKPVTNAFEALQGKAAGVDITSGSRPGSVGDIRIRGNRSISASNSPLYVVDGVPLSAGGIETINTADIESIDILKDASSTAIYGSRGANGVVLVTTKRGKSGTSSLRYSGSATFSQLVDKAKAMKASDYITWRRWAYYNADNNNPIPEGANVDWNALHEKDQSYFSGDATALANVNRGWSQNGGSWTWDGSRVEDYDWTGIVTRTGLTHEHTLSASGGSDKVQASGSFGYLSNQGTQMGQDYERFSAALTVDIQAKPWFKFGGSLNGSFATQNYGFSSTGQSSSSGPGDLYAAAKALLRYTLPYDANGDLITTPGGSTTNAYNIMDEWKKEDDQRKTFRVLGSFYGQIDFGKLWEPLKGLTYKVAIGPDFRHYRRGVFIDANSAVRLGSTNYVNRDEQRYFSWTLDNQINYNKDFNKDNKLGVTLLQSASSFQRENNSMSEQGIPFSSMKWNNMGYIDITQSQFKASMGTGLSENQLSSYMVRVNYSLKNRYLLTASGRWDGASVLAEGNKWAFFPSAALGWRLEQEDWLKDTEWIDQLKLRLGFGSTGNSAVGAYGTLGAISSYWMPFSTGNANILVTNEPYYTSGANQKPNKNLGWEKTTQWNYGIDFSFLGGRLGGTIDLYHSRTTDLLLAMTLPTLSGYPAQMANIGETKNKGVDITINAVPVRVGDFEWSTNLTAGIQKDEIVELANGKEDDLSNNWFIGQSIAIHYGYETAGLWQESDAAEIEKWNANGNKFKPGMVRPVDQDGDYKITDKDKVILGNRNPRLTMGWNNTFSYKGLELAVEMYGRFKYMINRGGQGQLGMYQQQEISYWTPTNTNADYQMPIYNQSGGDPYSSLLGFQKASFLKLRNVSLGYFVPKKVCKNLGISSVKVYAQARNLCDIYSTMSDYDLDLGRTYFDRGYTVGLQVEF